jgi:hypothetical protein
VQLADGNDYPIAGVEAFSTPHGARLSTAVAVAARAPTTAGFPRGVRQVRAGDEQRDEEGAEAGFAAIDLDGRPCPDRDDAAYSLPSKADRQAAMERMDVEF